MFHFVCHVVFVAGAHINLYVCFCVCGFCLIFYQVALALDGSTMSGSLQRRKKSKRKWKQLWFLLKDKVLYTFTACEVRGHRVSRTSPKTLMVTHKLFLAIFLVLYTFGLWGSHIFTVSLFMHTTLCVTNKRDSLCSLCNLLWVLQTCLLAAN